MTLPSFQRAQRNHTAPKILKTGQVGARGNASNGLIHFFNRILIRGVDENQNMRFRLDLPSKLVGLRIGLARFSLHCFVHNMRFRLDLPSKHVGLRVGLARFSSV